MRRKNGEHSLGGGWTSQRLASRALASGCASKPLDDGGSLDSDQPIEYERDDLAENIAYLAAFPQATTAFDLGIPERGWRNLIKRV